MAVQTRRVKQSPMEQGSNESIVYEFDFTDVASGTPSSPAVTLYDDFGNTITSTCVTGSPSVSGAIVSTGVVASLKPDYRYWLHAKALDGSSYVELILEIHCTLR